MISGLAAWPAWGGLRAAWVRGRWVTGRAGGRTRTCRWWRWSGWRSGSASWLLPNGPPLPGSDGDLTSCHDAQITTDTIIPAGLGDKLDLDLAIWACFANARIDQQQTSQHHDQPQAA